MITDIRNDWTRAEVAEIYNAPLMDLMYKASTVHKAFQETGEVQVCTLMSIKTGGCSEDCSYCAQSAKYNTDITVEKLLDKDKVVNAAKKAKSGGSTRFCMA